MEISLVVSPPVRIEELNELFRAAWPGRREADMLTVLNRALFYVCAYSENTVVGFAKVISDGGVHGFLLDPTVAPDQQRKGIGRQLVTACADESRRRGIEWLHVDFEPHLKAFYKSCGFTHTEAGLQNLKI